MGVPRLAQLLEPYGQNISLGCHRQHAQCHHNIDPQGQNELSHDTSMRGLIIDGPAMVHFVYNRLLTLSQSGLPPYSRLAEAILYFLTGLEEYGLEIAAIYFDGALPGSKRPVRLARLESSLGRLAKLKATYPHGFSHNDPAPKSTEKKCDPAELLGLEALLISSRAIASGLSSWPIPPFIVPACLDHLATSKFADLVVTVPGEADGFCASHAFRHGGLVLSGDSDLLVHDLGPNGGYVPLNSLTQGTYSEGSDEIISLLHGRIYRRHEIEQHLKIKDLVRVAFEVGEDPHVTLAMATQRARQDLLPTESQRFESFRSLYEEPSPASGSKQVSETKMLKSLDPRIAEFIWQLENTAPNSDAIHVYLPLLFEDPARACAWAIGAEVRDLAYNAAISSYTAGSARRTVVEMVRSGPKRVAGRNVALCGVRELNRIAQRWRDRLDAVRKFLPDAPEPVFWMVLALVEMHAWYIHSGRSPPSTNHLKTFLTDRGSLRPGSRSWYGIHLDAQVQAVVYSFRILQQILQSCVDLSDGLKELRAQVCRLPPLADVLEGSLGYVDVDMIVDLVNQIEEGRDSKLMPDNWSSHEAKAVAAETPPRVSSKGKGRRKHSSSGDLSHHAQLKEAIRSENMYNVLANHNA